ncbi:hypothetical protein K456DRAFT_55744, partial [Colletotrichum gloeosporioides 23]
MLRLCTLLSRKLAGACSHVSRLSREFLTIPAQVQVKEARDALSFPGQSGLFLLCRRLRSGPRLFDLRSNIGL